MEYNCFRSGTINIKVMRPNQGRRTERDVKHKPQERAPSEAPSLRASGLPPLTAASDPPSLRAPSKPPVLSTPSESLDQSPLRPSDPLTQSSLKAWFPQPALPPSEPCLLSAPADLILLTAPSEPLSLRAPSDHPLICEQWVGWGGPITSDPGEEDSRISVKD